ncbi:MAG: hypothetical protein ACRC0J_01650, partial [Shewanella oncorhynchi]
VVYTVIGSLCASCSDWQERRVDPKGLGRNKFEQGVDEYRERRVREAVKCEQERFDWEMWSENHVRAMSGRTCLEYWGKHPRFTLPYILKMQDGMAVNIAGKSMVIGRDCHIKFLTELDEYLETLRDK